MSFGDLKVQDLIYEDSSNNEITVVIADLATKANPVFSGTVTVPTATAGDNSTKAASTAFVVASFAPKASPVFSGTVTVPTATAGDNSTKAASTAFVVASFAPKNAPAFTGSATGVNLTLSGDLTVNGTTTTINTTTLQVEDKNIEIGKVSSPSDTTADGGGWTLLGSTNKTFNWLNATDSWTSSEHIEIASGKNLKVDGTTFFVDGTNNKVGIGTTSPAEAFSVNGTLLVGTGSAGNHIRFARSGLSAELIIGVDGYGNANNNEATIQSGASRPLVFMTSAAERMRIDQYGRLFLGTTTAGEGSADDLTIATTGQTGVTIRSGASAGGQIYFADGTSGDDRQRGIISYQHGGNYMRFYTNASERLRITEDGAFGIAGANYGSSGQVLTSGGASAAPSWADAGGGAWELLNSGSDTSAAADAGTIIEGLQTTYSDYKVIKIEFYVHFSNNTSYAGFQFKVGGSWLAGSGYHSQCEYGRHTNSSHMSQDTNSNSSITINEDSNDRCENIAGTLAWHRGPSSEDAMLTWDAKGMAYSGANYDFFLFNGAGGEAGTTNNTIQGIQWKNSNTSNIWWKVIGMK
jgi:hypothetical protein